MHPSSSRPLADDRSAAKAAALALLKRIHFYIGLFVGPFIFIAAFTGVLYVVTPQIENKIYADNLFTSSIGNAQPLSRQIESATKAVGDRAEIYAIRPAPGPGETTRVQFAEPGLGASKSRAIFVDPVTLDVKGDLIVYGTSGVLPFRTWLDDLHRGLLLGDIGRNYSELAASWLWVAAIGGVLLWSFTRRASRPGRKVTAQGARLQRGRLWHTSLGLILLAGLLFFSATGLTWSQWAGNNIGILRADMGWLTPSVNTQLGQQKAVQPVNEHAEHHTPSTAKMSKMQMAMPDMPTTTDMSSTPDVSTTTDMSSTPDMPTTTDMSSRLNMPNMPDMPEMNSAATRSLLPVSAVSAATFDGVVSAARQAGIDAAKIEIRPSYQAGKAWTVSEIDRSWPTQVDAVAVDPQSLQVTSQVYFAHFPLLAKLTRWGVDAHMGVLFGVWNQIILVFFGLGSCALIGWGYVLWWQRRPKITAARSPSTTLIHTWRALPVLMRWAFLMVVVALAFSLPVMGVSLLVFLTFDQLRWQWQVRGKKTVAVRSTESR